MRPILRHLSGDRLSVALWAFAAIAIAAVAAGFTLDHDEEFQDLEERRGRFSDRPDDVLLARWNRADLTSRALYDEVRHEITVLRDVLTPRVLELAEDPALTELLFDIERAERF